jgi:hypothetical protein
MAWLVWMVNIVGQEPTAAVSDAPHRGRDFFLGGIDRQQDGVFARREMVGKQRASRSG